MYDITRLSELHAATTQGDWQARRFEGIVGGVVVSIEMTFADWQSCCESHNAWPAVEAELTRLREFERFVVLADKLPTTVETSIAIRRLFR